MVRLKKGATSPAGAGAATAAEGGATAAEGGFKGYSKASSRGWGEEGDLLWPIDT